METPFFSIIIPVYQVERYLPACLESVRAQDFDDYEIILVDDGSKDASGNICDDYCGRYPEMILSLIPSSSAAAFIASNAACTSGAMPAGS